MSANFQPNQAQPAPAQPNQAQAPPTQSNQAQAPPTQANRPSQPSQPDQAGLFATINSFFKKHKALVISILSLIALLVAVKMIFFKPAVISVVGTGRLTAKPDQVEMLITRVDSNPDPILAINNGEDSINKITAKAKEIAGEEVKIQKSFYQVTPSVATGDVLYQVVNVFRITADDPTKAADLIKGFYSSGATTVSGVNFIPENQEQVTQDARKAAIKDARKQAKSIARASGKRVGHIISISDDLSQGNSNVSTEGQTESDQQGEKPKIQYASGVPSEIDVAKSMTVTYQIW